MKHPTHVNEHDTAFQFEREGNWYASEGSAIEAYQTNRRRMRVLPLALAPVFAAIMATISAAILLSADVRDARIASVIGFALIVGGPGMYLIVRMYVRATVHEKSIHLPEGVALRLTPEDRDHLCAASEEGVLGEALDILKDEWEAARHEDSQPSRNQAEVIMRGTPAPRSR